MARKVIALLEEQIREQEAMQMTPADIKSARQRLGLTQQGLAEALRLGPNGERTVRRWEQGDVPITGPASVAIEYMLSAGSRSVAQPE